MKFTILCDEKPKNCEECPFYEERLISTEKENTVELVNRCKFADDKDDNHIVKCPLNEIDVIFDTKKTD